MNIPLADLWTAAGVLLGFQVTSFIWRIDREVKVRETGGIVWLTPADLVNIVSMIVIVVGVFVFPIFGLTGSVIPKDAFGLAALLFIGHAFARAGHYGLYGFPFHALQHSSFLRILRKTKEPPPPYRPSPETHPPSLENYSYFPRQEKVVVVIITIVAITYVIVAIIVR